MSTLVKVWNRSKYDWKERFKGEEIKIPAGSFIEMEYLDGVEFAGQFSGLPPSDHPKPEMFHKLIDVDKPTEPLFTDDEAQKKVGANANDAATITALTEAIKGLAPQAPAAPVENAEVAALKEQVARLSAMIEGQNVRKKPGPKPKVRATA